MHDPTAASPVWTGPPTRTPCASSTAGRVVVEFDVAHTADGLGELCRRVERAGARRVAIERPDGPVVDALLEAGLEVVVVSSRSVKALRERYGTSGNKSDRSDAYVLADCLRTDGHRWRSLEPDSPATVTLRAHVRARKDLVETRVAVANQLRAHLRIVFPGAVGLFRDIDSPISLRFLERFPSATRAAWLSEKRLGAWLRANGYCGRKTPAELYARLSAPPSGHRRRRRRRPRRDHPRLRHRPQDPARPDRRARHPPRRAPRRPPRRPHLPVPAPLRHHPRRHPARRDRRLPSPLPRPESLACLAGVAPSTRASGRHRAVTFRWSSDKKLRDALCDFAGDSWRGQPLGRPPLPPTPRRRQEPPPRRTHPRPQLGPHHLALLARPHPLRPHPPRRPPTPPTGGGLT